jgi:hypothetical protein
MTDLDENRVELIGSELDAAIQSIAARHGFEYGSRQLTWSELGFKFRFEFTTPHVDGIDPAWIRDWPGIAGIYEIDPGALGQTFEDGGQTYCIVGADPKKRKRPILVQNAQGKTYCYSGFDIHCRFPSDEFKARMKPPKPAK